LAKEGRTVAVIDRKYIGGVLSEHRLNQPVENAVGQRGIADLLVPPADRQLRSQDRGAV